MTSLSVKRELDEKFGICSDLLERVRSKELWD